MKKIKADIKEAEEQNNMIATKVKEKDQEARLNELKFRQLRRRIPHKTLKPLFTVRNSKLKNSVSSTHYVSQPLTSRGPFNKNGTAKVGTHTQFKIKKRKLPSVTKSKRSNLQSPDVVIEEQEDERQNNIKTDAEESIKSPKPQNPKPKEKHEIQNIRDKIQESKIPKEIMSPTAVHQ